MGTLVLFGSIFFLSLVAIWALKKIKDKNSKNKVGNIPTQHYNPDDPGLWI